jgi:hypothetical protein
MTRAVAIALLVISTPAAEAFASEPDPAAEPEPPPPKTPFDRGRMGLSVGGGSTTAFGARYFAVGGGFGYYVLDGVEVGLAPQVQWGDGPTIARLTPSLRYVVQPLVGKFPLIPYAGVFYSHWFVGDGVPDVDAAGARSGLLYVSGALVLGIGVAYERVVSECTMDCSVVYPDFTLSLAL